MVYISTDAAVRMAKAGAAYEKAQHDVVALRTNPLRENESPDEAFAILSDAQLEWAHAVRDVAEELYRQNLHNMTEPA